MARASFLGASLASLLAVGCGAKTGLRVDPPAPFDASVVDVPAPDPRCRPLTIRTRVGVAAPLRVEVDEVTPVEQGFSWTLRSAPRRSTATVSASTGPTATLTPDVEGTYDVSVSTPYALEDGGLVACTVTVIADPADPLCPGYALEEPTVVRVPGAPANFAFERGWSTPRVNDESTRGLIATDAPNDNVAALVFTLASNGRDLATISDEVEGRAAQSVGATPVLVGRAGSTVDDDPIRRSTFRVASLSTTAAVLRDRLARDVAGLNPGPARPGFAAATSFTLQITTALLADAGRAVVMVSAAPEARFDDARAQTAIRLQDVTNATGLARAGAELDVVCQRTETTRTVSADFLWLVDTSRSMEDDQERLGNTAERFFNEMNAAGIDFRVGVVQAGSDPAGPDLDDPGFAWISGSDPEGPRRLSWEVTYQRFREDPRDALQPYPLLGGEEEPLAAAVVTAEAMDRRAMDPSDARRFRERATRVAFFVTDEAGTNDDQRFFALDRVRWGSLREDRVRGVTEYFRERAWLTFAMANLFSRSQCPSTDNFVPCVVTGNGGAYIPLSTALDAEVGAALSRIVDAVAGAASEFVLDRPPLSSTLRVAVDERLVPRSRADGFDYDSEARSIVFRGNTWRPRMGQSVRSAYFFWARARP